MDAKTEPNDNLLDLPAALTTSQKILVGAMQELLRRSDEQRRRDEKELERRVQAVADKIDAANGKRRGLWQAIWHGLGVIKAEGDKIFKE